MDILTVFITKIHSIEEHKHVVLVDCDTDCYGRTEHNQIVFHKYQWSRIHAQMKYLETEGFGKNSLEYYESLTDDEYHKRFERSLHEFTDKELADEINYRLEHPLFHNLQFSIKAVTEDG